MASGQNDSPNFDPLTDWATAAIEIIKAIHPQVAVEEKAVSEKMLMLVQMLDQGDLDSVFGNEVFMQRTEDLLLAMFRADEIKVANPYIFDARNEIFAAAQVIYNQGVVRGSWKLHPEIRQAMDHNR